MNSRIILLKTMLLSTSRINKVKYSKDKKVKSKAIGGMVGVSLIYLMIMMYCVATAIGYGLIGIANAIPATCAVTISAIAFFFTILKTNGYLFAFKEYDMLMSLPFSPKTIAADKFLYMYVATLPWYITVSLAMLIGYGVFAKPSIIAYFVWIVFTFVLPIIPMIVAAFIGFLIARVSAGFRKTNIVQTVLLFIFCIFCFSLQFIIDAVLKNNDIELVVEKVADNIEGIGKYFPPVAWFSGAIVNLRISDMLLLLGVTVLLFEIVFSIVGKNYRQINSALTSHAATKQYKMTVQKKRNVVNSIAFKEFKCFTGCQAYLVNAGMGEVLAFILTIVALFVKFDKIIQVVTKGAPISADIVFPAIPLIAYFLIGMVATTACSPSLEGKNYWILQSMPISKKTIYHGKMLFNLYLAVPFAILLTLSLSFSARVPVLNVIIYMFEVIALCLFSTTYGCVCGVKHLRLDWENEIEVVKQSSGVALYMLPNMFGCMALIVLSVFLGTRIDGNVVCMMIAALALILTVICYLRVMKLADVK